MNALALAAIVALSSAGIVPHDDSVIQDSCDLIELNHHYDDEGRKTFSQLIFYEWDAYDCRHQVRAWRMLKETAKEATDPRKPNWQVHFDYERQRWIATGDDGECNREVRAGLFRETWTQYDPELLERDILPKEHRRELSTRKLPAEWDSPPQTDRDGFPIRVEAPAWLPWGRGP
jgi:hypothetical protein